MKKGFQKAEHIVDKLIPYIVILLLIVIIATFFFKEFTEKYHHQIEILDTIIISVFVVDLVFKYMRVRKIKKFVRSYWLDILAVFPFYLVLRVVEEAYLLFRVSEAVQESQTALHAGIGIKEVTATEKEAAKIITEIEKSGKISRSRFAVRFFRPISRVPRLIKVLPYYEKSHHPKKKRK